LWTGFSPAAELHVRPAEADNRASFWTINIFGGRQQKNDNMLCKRPCCLRPALGKFSYCSDKCETAHLRHAYFIQNVEQIFDPFMLEMIDPRYPSQNVLLIAFYFADKEELWDHHFASSFLGNFFPLEEELCIPIAGYWRKFQTAEAAFQALKFGHQSHIVEEFEILTSGHDAFELKKKHGSSEERGFDGRGSNWLAMWEVLLQKFKNTKMQNLLLKTGDAFLLEHNPRKLTGRNRKGRDVVWSDDWDGEGRNWLGALLMLLRDYLRKQRGEPPLWEDYLAQIFNMRTGEYHHGQEQIWQAIVRMASQAIREIFS
jgi:predicted NAD-dependent protein-ADP-ribosyltransferase YbiA (DUF1768 family)